MKAGLYIRVSTEEQKIKGYSLPEQIESCKKKAKELGATEFEIFPEEGESGAYLDRPELERLLQAVSYGEIQLVITLDTDRLSRDLGGQIYIAKEIEKHAKLDFVTYSRGDPNNPEDNLFFHIKGAFAQYDRAKIRANTTRGKKQKALTGKIVIPGGWTGHPGAYGYIYRKDKEPQLEIKEEEAEIIRYIYSLAYEDNLGIVSIAKTLNNKGIPSPKGSIWHYSTVGRILRNELYAGVFYNYKYRTLMTEKRTSGGKRQNLYRLRPHSERIPVEVPAIIDRKVWDIVQAKLKENAALNRKVGNVVLLKGRINCGLCGEKCAVRVSGGIYYRCKGTKTGCTLPGIPVISSKKRTGLDNVIWEAIIEALSNPTIIKQELQKDDDENTVASLDKSITELKSKSKSLEKQKDELLNLRLEGLLTSEELRKRLVKLENKKKQYELEIKNLETQKEAIDRTIIDIDEFCAYYLEKMRIVPHQEKAKYVKELGIQIKAFPNNKYEIHWPFSTITVSVKPPARSSVSSLYHRAVAMTPEIKEVLLQYCQETNQIQADVIRQALNYITEEKYENYKRGKRFRSTICLSKKELEKLDRIQKLYNQSASVTLEWAIKRYLTHLEKL